MNYLRKEHQITLDTKNSDRFFALKYAVFVAPKTYSLIDQHERSTQRLKGVTRSNVTHEDIASAFFSGSQIEKEQEFIGSVDYQNKSITTTKLL